MEENGGLNMKHQKLTIFGIIIVVIAVIVGFAWVKTSKAQRYVQSTTPTLFFHGGGSSYHAEEHMVNAAKRAGVTDTVIRANVDPNGKVTLSGSMTKHSINPIVEVNYENNRQLDFSQHGRWLLTWSNSCKRSMALSKLTWSAIP